MTKLPAVAFFVLGSLYFLVATGFLSRTSETALMDGSVGLVPGVTGAIGALLGRRTVGRAVLVGLLAAALSVVLLVGFFQILWPML